MMYDGILLSYVFINDTICQTAEHTVAFMKTTWQSSIYPDPPADVVSADIIGVQMFISLLLVTCYQHWEPSQ